MTLGYYDLNFPQQMKKNERSRGGGEMEGKEGEKGEKWGGGGRRRRWRRRRKESEDKKDVT